VQIAKFDNDVTVKVREGRKQQKDPVAGESCLCTMRY